VSKHTTCDDVDEGEVKRLVEVPGCRCLRHDVDVDAVLFGMNKACKNQNPNKHVNARKFEAKRTHRSCQNLDFMSKGQMDVKRGIIVLKRRQIGVKRCSPALAGLEGQLFPVSVQAARSVETWRGVLGARSWAEVC
jgi:hypothetical protein